MARRWTEWAGLPGAEERRRNRPLKGWEVAVYRVYFIGGTPLALLLAFAMDNIGVALSALTPVLLILWLPSHQRRQVFGRTRTP